MEGGFPAGSRIARSATGSRTARRGSRTGRMVLLVVIVASTAALATAWSFAAQRQLMASIVDESAEHLDHAQQAFAGSRTKTQANLVSHCRILVEDPRLKSTLATEGMDAATVADILKDLGELRGSGFLLVLSPEGRVFAEAGAAGLGGIDLSESSVVKKAQGTAEAVVGSWVLENRVMDLAVMVIRYDESVIGYLVVGQSVDEPVLKAVADQTGVQVASALAGSVVLASSSAGPMKSVLARVAAEAGGFKGRVMTIDGETYVTSVVELAESAQAQRLVLVRSVGGVMPKFERLKLMILVPPLLVLVAVLLAMSATRAFRRT
jgi:hypothetical protein